MIIGLTGSFGAGKGWVADYLVKQKNFKHFSARTFIIAEIEKRGLTINRDSMTVVANDLRKNYGPTYIFEQLTSLAKEQSGDFVIESIRAVAEARYLKKQGGIVLGIDAKPEIRYERIKRRGNETDQVSFAKWQEQEKAESNPDDPTKQDIFGALRESDIIISNDGNIKELTQKVEDFLSKYRQNID